MKFGSQLRDAIYPEWQQAYLDYDGLKKKLRKAEKDTPFSERDETEFVELLDNNLEKVYAFHKEKMEDIRTRTDHWAETISSQLPSNDSVEEMGRIQENINDIADDINRLARYSRINYTGFLKIVKKHDRHTDYVLRPMFMVRLNQCPFWNENNDSLLLKLSQLFAQVRQGGRTMSFQQPPINHVSTTQQQYQQLQLNEITSSYDPHSQQSSARRTVVRRFFVQADNVLELKTYVLRHLPVLVYRDITGKKDNIDPPISTLYLDNPDLDAYNSRVESAQGSQIIRLRWYGSAKRNNSIAFERRTLAEENCGELKDRFVIKDKYISDFIQGGHAYVDKYSQKLRNTAGKSEQDVQHFQSLVNEVQQTILKQKMQPVLRTYYKRTAFQIPGDKSVRMALDTDLCFLREDTGIFDKVIRRPDDAWRRPDADIQFPFTNINENDINRYPFATFEIKMDLAPGQIEPEWVTDLQESGILEEAFDFSKFVHGIAVMFDTRVALLPYWLAQMGDDLHNLPHLPSMDQKKSSKGKGRASSAEEDNNEEELEEDAQTTTALTDDTNPSDERTSLLRRPHHASTSSYTTFPKLTEPESHEEPSLSWAQRCMKDLTLVVQHIFLGQTSPRRSHAASPPVILPPGVKVPKKVITPLRVEPKVFFANERTYFSWMSFGTLLATFSIALFNAGDAVGKVSGIVYTLVSLSTLLYGMGLYYRRRELIRQRASGPYDDMTGPTVICFALLFAVGLNAYLKFAVKSPSLLYL
ncbi:VTC domain-containing protein [Halteromyces radiatus]|uniref:VTC domain-containing protein n=1 Tax=Halteromyces radiatus TaxID=101107 RepID=UPI00221FBFCE|nr:VTC domain-containing protein [Halteromyces radiatus]KAI8084662.1 VTC domain-containing protein [Halteromyces radiatus]